MTDVSGGEWLPGLADPIEIGRGGFGVVYKATETDLNRTVAVKILSGNLDDLALQRFDRERRAMGALSGHPNIVPIYRSGLTVDGRPYLVMEFQSQGSLAERMVEKGPLPWTDAASIGVRLCAALETAHRAGVLHRDVKPENVFISGLGAPKLGDFGIARLEGAPQTQSAMITASLAHAAPELIDGKPPSVQSDIYGLSSTIVTFMTGIPPFSRETDESIVPLLARIATEPLPDLRPRGVPERLCQVFEKAMAKDPEPRFESTALFGRALQEAQASEGITVTPLEVQGIDPTVTPGVGAPRVADPTVTVPAPGQVPPAAAAPIVASTPPAATPAPSGSYMPPAATASPASVSAGYATPVQPSVSGPLPVYGTNTGTTTVESGGGTKLAIILGIIAVVVVGGLIGLLVLGGGGDDPEAGPGASTTVTTVGSASSSSTPDSGPGGPTTLAPGSIGPSGLVVTSIPFGLGDNATLDALAVECAAGELSSCDQLYDDSPVGSLFEDFGATCGARVEFDPNTPCPSNEAISS